MKKIFLVSFLFTALHGLSQQYSNLTINTTSGSNLKIRFDDKKYSLQDRTVTFQNLTPGIHSLVIYQLQKNNAGLTNYREMYNGNITLNAGKHIEVCVLRFGKIAWDEGIITGDEWNENQFSPVEITEPGSNGPLPASANEMRSITTAIQADVSDNQKLATAKAIMKNYSFNVSQVRMVCDLLINEEKKLELAEYLYKYCYNKRQYFELRDLFISSEIKERLMDFINSQ